MLLRYYEESQERENWYTKVQNQKQNIKYIKAKEIKSIKK